MKQYSFAPAASLAPGPTLAHAADAMFAKGADVGWVSEMEASGRVFGASSCPATAKNPTWQAATRACLANLNDMVHRYGKPVILSDLIAKARAVDGGGARGVFYWEPEAYDWKGYPMGAFDRGGKPAAIMDAFLER